MRATVERGIEEGIVMFPIGPGNSHQGDVLTFGTRDSGRIIHITLRGLSAEIGLLHNQLPLASDALEQATRLVTAYQAAYKDPLQSEPREYRFIPIPQIPLAA